MGTTHQSRNRLLPNASAIIGSTGASGDLTLHHSAQISQAGSGEGSSINTDPNNTEGLLQSPQSALLGKRFTELLPKSRKSSFVEPPIIDTRLPHVNDDPASGTMYSGRSAHSALLYLDLFVIPHELIVIYCTIHSFVCAGSPGAFTSLGSSNRYPQSPPPTAGATSAELEFPSGTLGSGPWSNTSPSLASRYAHYPHRSAPPYQLHSRPSYSSLSGSGSASGSISATAASNAYYQQQQQAAHYPHRIVSGPATAIGLPSVSSSTSSGTPAAYDQWGHRLTPPDTPSVVGNTGDPRTMESGHYAYSAHAGQSTAMVPQSAPSSISYFPSMHRSSSPFR